MQARSSRKIQAAKTASPLMVRLDKESKQCLAEAANLRHVSVSDYVRTVTVPQARARSRRQGPGHCPDARRAAIVLERLERKAGTDAGAAPFGLDHAAHRERRPVSSRSAFRTALP